MRLNLDIKTNIHELQARYGTPFDYQKLKISGTLKYFRSEVWFTLCNQARRRVIDPDKISWIDNHYQDNPNERYWLNMLGKERCLESSSNISKARECLYNNPMYYFDGSMQKDDCRHPVYCHYNGKYYLIKSDGNHRTVIAKYLWHFNKELLTRNGKDGIRTMAYDIPKINITMLSLYKYIISSRCFCTSDKYLYSLSLDSDCMYIVVTHNDITKRPEDQKLRLLINTTYAEEFKNALQLRYLFTNFGKQKYYWEVFDDLFDGKFKKLVISNAKNKALSWFKKKVIPTGFIPSKMKTI